MAKFYGKIGFAMTTETSPSVYEEVFVEENYYGDVLNDQRRWQQNETLNDDMKIQMRISIIANAFAYKNWQSMRYVEHLGVLWKIVSASIKFPRIELNIGEVYNGKTTNIG